ncbi:MAG: ribosome small subunit-dependent GTPase A [Candidatus Kaiserbacteria bacterium]|nr:ribosome small subunit-dependent GTPase A [Candidatus Kaiserbacteria bacterium]MCB9815854.1 ribosome small subunit-dependent GTPase A [Candidatus Nomurabacteria bacterium]
MKTGRVTEVHRTNLTVRVDDRELLATVRGDFHVTGAFPVVGDYVSLKVLADDKAVIEEVLERKSVIKRKAADAEEEQTIVANVDVIFIVMGLDGDYSISRLERYLLLAQQSAVPAVVVLNKSDVVDDTTSYQTEVEAVAGDTPVCVISALSGKGMDTVLAHIASETTAVLLGSSGAGKSTMTNWLLQEEVQEVNETRADDSHGRHTTTSRQLFALPHGGYLIDTPGMRELGVLESDADDELLVFAHIEELAQQCKYRDCDHEKSDGCAVLAAIAAGELEERELQNYLKLQREREFNDSKGSPAAARHRRQNEKRLSQKIEAMKRDQLKRRAGR